MLVLILTVILICSYLAIIPYSSGREPGFRTLPGQSMNPVPSVVSYSPYGSLNTSYQLTINAKEPFVKVTVFFGDGTSTSVSGSGSSTYANISHTYVDAGRYYIWYTVQFSSGSFTSVSSLIPVQIINTAPGMDAAEGIIASTGGNYLYTPGQNASSYISYFNPPLNGSYSVYGQYLKAILLKNFGNVNAVRYASEIEDYVWKKKTLAANLDFYAALYMHLLGIDEKYYLSIFATARVFGWVAHYMEQQENNKLIRPLAFYTGPENSSID